MSLIVSIEEKNIDKEEIKSLILQIGNQSIKALDYLSKLLDKKYKLMDYFDVNEKNN